jgi:ATP-binding cassette subfamily F protein 3
VQRGHLVEFGYYDQHLHTLPADKPVIRAVWPDAPSPLTPLPPGERGRGEGTEQSMRDLLGRFGLTGEQVYQRVGDLSGGEKSRAALAKLVAQGVNVLVLDEPTNHLDLWACDALEQALLEFEGTVIVVSHDRYFLNRVVGLLLVLDGAGNVQVIHGNYDTYELMRAQQIEAARSHAERGNEEGTRKKTEPSAAKAQPAAGQTMKGKRKRKFPYRKVEDLESDIAATEMEIQELEQLLASPELYRDGERVKQTTKAFEEAKAHLQQLYEHWEEAVELN